MDYIDIGGRRIGYGYPVFVVAEVSANHKQDLSLALKTIKAAKKAGADAVKFQIYRPDTITIDSSGEYFRITQGTLWDGRTLYDLYKEAYMPWEWYSELVKTAKSLGLVIFSTPFDPTAVDFLETMETPAYKIASYEITDTPLIEYAAAKGKPMLLSTGIATADDIEAALSACQRAGNTKVALLKCTSVYPTPPEEMNLLTIPYLRETFGGTEVGLSDHSRGIAAVSAAVALGAHIVEKHFILHSSLGGLDSAFSIDPDQFAEMVQTVRLIEKSLGTAGLVMTEKMKKSREHCRSLFVIADMVKGEPFTTSNIRSIRPGFGLPPRHLPDVLGKKAASPIIRGTPLQWDLIS